MKLNAHTFPTSFDISPTHSIQIFLMTFLPSNSPLPLVRIVPESARWLLSKGRTEETMKIISRAAHINKMPLTPEVMKELRVRSSIYVFYGQGP